MSATLDVLALIVHSAGFAPGVALGLLGGQILTFSVMAALIAWDESAARRRSRKKHSAAS